jgi:hypothetical protein
MNKYNNQKYQDNILSHKYKKLLNKNLFNYLLNLLNNLAGLFINFIKKYYHLNIKSIINHNLSINLYLGNKINNF